MANHNLAKQPSIDNPLVHSFAQAERSLQKKPQLSPENDKYLANKFVGRFGLKTSMDVIAFLNSPTGKTVQAIIYKTVLEIKELEIQQQQTQQEALRRKHLALAFLIAALLYRRRHKKMLKLNEMIERQIRHHLKELQKNLSETELKVEADFILYQQMHTYHLALEELDKLLEEKQKALQATAEEIQTLEHQLAALAQEKSLHKDLAKHLEALALSVQQMPNQIDAYRGHLAKLEQEILSQTKASASQMTPQLKPQADLNHLYRMQLQAAGIKHMIACHQNNRRFVDLQGNPVAHYHQAAFALPRHIHLVYHQESVFALEKAEDVHRLISNPSAHLQFTQAKKIVRDHDGACYFIPANESLENIKNSENAKDRLLQAKQAYHEFVMQHGCVPHQVQHQHQMKTEYLQGQLLQLRHQHQNIQQELLEINNQKNQLEADREQYTQEYQRSLQQVRVQITQPNPIIHSDPTKVPNPAPTLTALPTMPVPEVKGKSAKKSISTNVQPVKPIQPIPAPGPSSYQKILFTMQPELRQIENIRALQNLLMNQKTRIAKQLQNDLKALENIPPNHPVPEKLGKDLAKGIEASGIRAQLNPNSPLYRLLNPSPYHS